MRGLAGTGMECVLQLQLPLQSPYAQDIQSGHLWDVLAIGSVSSPLNLRRIFVKGMHLSKNASFDGGCIPTQRYMHTCQRLSPNPRHQAWGWMILQVPNPDP